jgi:hypothetical protein
MSLNRKLRKASNSSKKSLTPDPRGLKRARATCRSLLIPHPLRQRKEDYNIFEVSLNKQGQAEYVGRGEVNNKLKHFTRRMVAESNCLFGKTLSFYSFRLKEMMTRRHGQIKKELMAQEGSKQ